MVKTILAGIGLCVAIAVFIFLAALVAVWLDDRKENCKIIRCKDCEHNENPPEAGNAACDLFYGMTEQYGFCHRAERRIE